MRILKRAAAAVALSGAVVGGALAGGVPASAAASDPADGIHIMGTCGDTKSADVPGGRAAWTVLCQNGQVTADGWVKDTRLDNRCAQVYGNFPAGGTFNTVSACGAGELKYFKQTGKGDTVNLYLRVR